MIPESFEYFAPTSVQEAVSLAQRHGEEAKFLSGGHSLLPMMKLRLAAPKFVIDLGGIRELTQITEESGKFKIGALVTHHALESSEKIRSRCQLLAQTAAQIGDPQVRNCGTLGGSISHADPAADYPAALLALEVEMEVEGPGGRRRISAADFFVDLFTSALKPGELLVAVHVPVLESNVGSAYKKLRQQASGFAIAGAAAIVAKDEGGKCHRIAIGVTGVGPKAFRATAAEKALLGKSLTEKNIEKACHQVASGIDVQGDIHASSDYRRAMADVFARRAVLAAAGLSQ